MVRSTTLPAWQDRGAGVGAIGHRDDHEQCLPAPVVDVADGG